MIDVLTLEWLNCTGKDYASQIDYGTFPLIKRVLLHSNHLASSVINISNLFVLFGSTVQQKFLQVIYDLYSLSIINKKIFI